MEKRSIIMIYSNKVKMALQLAFEAHKNQTDRGGIPYIYHPIHLAEQMMDEKTIVVALLHDVAEDSDYTIEDMENMGFGFSIIRALRLLKHEKGVPYMEYIKLIKQDDIARIVKLADLQHNCNLSRLPVIMGEDVKRVEKYKAAIKLLES